MKKIAREEEKGRKRENEVRGGGTGVAWDRAEGPGHSKFRVQIMVSYCIQGD
jgi:hypothetical protein